MSARHNHITPDAKVDLARLLADADSRSREPSIISQMVGGALWAVPFIVVALLLRALS